MFNTIFEIHTQGYISRSVLNMRDRLVTKREIVLPFNNENGIWRKLLDQFYTYSRHIYSQKTIIINHRLLSINHSDNPVAMVWKLRYNMEKSLTFDTTNSSCTCKFKSETDFSCVLSIYCGAPQTKQANIRELVRHRIYKPLGFFLYSKSCS